MVTWGKLKVVVRCRTKRILDTDLGEMMVSFAEIGEGAERYPSPGFFLS